MARSPRKKKPASNFRKPRAAQPAKPAEPISFEDFVADPELLGLWHGDQAKWHEGRERYATVLEASARAAYAAVVTLKGKRGLISIYAVEASMAREARDAIQAFYERPMLKQLVKRNTPDGVELVSGIRIEATSNSMSRPTDLALGITVAEEAQPRYEALMDDPLYVFRTVAFAASRDPNCELVRQYNEVLKTDIVRVLRESREAQERATEEAKLRDRLRDAGASSNFASLPCKPSAESQRAPAPIGQRAIDRDTYIVSPEFERERAANMGLYRTRRNSQRWAVPLVVGQLGRVLINRHPNADLDAPPNVRHWW